MGHNHTNESRLQIKTNEMGILVLHCGNFLVYYVSKLCIKGSFTKWPHLHSVYAHYMATLSENCWFELLLYCRHIIFAGLWLVPPQTIVLFNSWFIFKFPFILQMHTNNRVRSSATVLSPKAIENVQNFLKEFFIITVSLTLNFTISSEMLTAWNNL